MANFKMIKLTAFTLAEVLIVVGIIGIISELTIPTLISNVQEQSLKTAWKKAYSELSQAQQMLIVDNGNTDFIGLCNDFDDKCLRDLFLTKIKAIKTCNNPINEKCVISNSKYLDNTTYWAGNGININDINWPTIITKSGYSVKFRHHFKDCEPDRDYDGHNYTGLSCGWMQIDVNGLKKPNTAGKDIFWLEIRKNKLEPKGTGKDKTTVEQNCTSETGVYCSMKYILE